MNAGPSPLLYMPSPEPGPWDSYFWSSAGEGKLVFQSCARCGRLRHPPTPVCPACGDMATAWVEAPAEAEIFAMTFVRQAPPGMPAEVAPYALAVVRFPALPGIKLVTIVEDARPGSARIGERVHLSWAVGADGGKLPVFRLVPGERPEET